MNFNLSPPIQLVVCLLFALLLNGCEAVSGAKPTTSALVATSESVAKSQRHSLAETLKSDPMMDAVSKRYPAQWTPFVTQLSNLVDTQAPIDQQLQLIATFRRSLAPQLRDLTSRMPDHLLSEFFAVKGDTYAFHAQRSPKQCEQAMHAGSDGRAAMQQLFGWLPPGLRDRHVKIMVRVIRETDATAPNVTQAVPSDSAIDAALQAENEPDNACAAFAARIKRIETLDPVRAARVYRSFLPGIVPSIYRLPAKVRVLGDGRTIALSGRLGSGSSDRLLAVLSSLNEASTVLLDSEGGLLSEGQRIAHVIAQLELDTRVENSCASACTIAFLAGRQRSANADAMIGFHQAGTTKATGTVSYLYRSVADYRRLYTHQAITDDFLARVASTPSAEVWYPKRDELISNGIVTDVIFDSSTQQAAQARINRTANTTQREQIAQRLLSLAPVQAFALRYPAEWQEEKDRLDDLIDSGVGIERLGRFSLARVFGRYHTLKRHAPDALVSDAVRYLHRRLSRSIAQGQMTARACSLRFLNSTMESGADWQQAIVAGVIATAQPEAPRTIAKNNTVRNQAWRSLRNQLDEKLWRAAWSTKPAQYSVRAQCQARILVLEKLMALPTTQSNAAARRLWLNWM